MRFIPLKKGLLFLYLYNHWNMVTILPDVGIFIFTSLWQNWQKYCPKILPISKFKKIMIWVSESLKCQTKAILHLYGKPFLLGVVFFIEFLFKFALNVLCIASKGQLISEWNFNRCLQISQKANQILDRFLPYEAKLISKFW